MKNWFRHSIVLGVFLVAGCSIKRMAINQLGNALAESGSTFTSDNDPELVKAALPFSLKLIESLLAENPRHTGLLLAAASGFTQFSYAFVHADADEMLEEDFAGADELRGRARRLYLRARDYGMRGLDANHPGLARAFATTPKQAVQSATIKDVPLLFWTAAAWGAAISVSKDDPAMIADQSAVEALIDRALALDEDFDQGAIHSFLISYEMARAGAAGDPVERARHHFERAMQLTGGQSAGPLVALAEAVSLETQNRGEFEALLQRALEIDPDKATSLRLSNLIAQRRARWLLSRADDLFFGSPEESGPPGL